MEEALVGLEHKSKLYCVTSLEPMVVVYSFNPASYFFHWNRSYLSNYCTYKTRFRFTSKISNTLMAILAILILLNARHFAVLFCL